MNDRKSPAPGAILFLSLIAVMAGCSGPSITAVRLSQGAADAPKEPEGIPYYLPKPYLIVTKNIYYIPAPTVGLTATVPIPNSFDSSNSPATGGKGATNSTGTTTNKPSTNAPPSKSQADDADIIDEPPASTGDPTTKKSDTNADNGGQPGTGTNSPSAGGSSVYGTQLFGPPNYPLVPPLASDGIVPQEFFTYQFVYLPDLTQKYGLRIHGGYGELRATENLVNGWMHTGPGPFYMRNSTTAEAVTATGQAVGSFVQSAGQIALNALGIPSLGGAASGSTPKTALETGGSVISNYAILYIFEPVLTDKTNVVWRQICQISNSPISFNRDFLGLNQSTNKPGGPLVTNTTMEEGIINFITTNFSSFVFTNLQADVETYSSNTSVVNVSGQVHESGGTSLATDALQSLRGQVQTNLFNYFKEQPSIKITLANIIVSKLTSPPPPP